MAALISATRTRKGGDGLRDKYNFNHVGNGSGLKTINWRCSLVGHSPNVWHIQELFIKQDAEVRRAYLSNAVGQDMTTNTGRKQRSLDARERLKCVVDAFDSVPRADYISTLAHDRQKFDQ